MHCQCLDCSDFVGLVRTIRVADRAGRGGAVHPGERLRVSPDRGAVDRHAQRVPPCELPGQPCGEVHGDLTNIAVCEDVAGGMV